MHTHGAAYFEYFIENTLNSIVFGHFRLLPINKQTHSHFIQWIHVFIQWKETNYNLISRSKSLSQSNIGKWLNNNNLKRWYFERGIIEKHDFRRRAHANRIEVRAMAIHILLILNYQYRIGVCTAVFIPWNNVLIANRRLEQSGKSPLKYK